MNDQKIIELLQSNKTDKAFSKLYKGYPKVEKLILSKGGTKIDAQDIYQEALIVLYRKATSTNFILTSQLSTYLYSVSRFLWKDELIKNNKLKGTEFKIEIIPEEESELEQIIEKENKLKQVEEILQTISEKCQKILRLFYFNGYKMKEIAKQMGYTSERVARTYKYKCMEKVKKSF